MRKNEFESVIQEALEQLPDQFKRALNNISIVVRWRPTGDELDRAEIGDHGDLFGLYVGVPLTERGEGYNLVVPDTIYIYQRAHEHHCRTEKQLVAQARKTLLHEVGHYLGIDEDRLHELGMG
ncbi:MAG: metallopeptidase family protein [Chloroflexi bacterium]|nr:metallopeptidase family protein [Chloroflexota bacterium]